MNGMNTGRNIPTTRYSYHVHTFIPVHTYIYTREDRSRGVGSGICGQGVGRSIHRRIVIGNSVNSMNGMNKPINSMGYAVHSCVHTSKVGTGEKPKGPPPPFLSLKVCNFHTLYLAPGSGTRPGRWGLLYPIVPYPRGPWRKPLKDNGISGAAALYQKGNHDQNTPGYSGEVPLQHGQIYNITGLSGMTWKGGIPWAR